MFSVEFCTQAPDVCGVPFAFMTPMSPFSRSYNSYDHHHQGGLLGPRRSETPFVSLPWLAIFPSVHHSFFTLWRLRGIADCWATVSFCRFFLLKYSSCSICDPTSSARRFKLEQGKRRNGPRAGMEKTLFLRGRRGKGKRGLQYSASTSLLCYGGLCPYGFSGLFPSSS